jgi:hypothetical protein
MAGSASRDAPDFAEPGALAGLAAGAAFFGAGAAAVKRPGP